MIGWGLGDLDTEAHICKHICVKANVCVIDVAYRLVPEHAFPLGIQDSFAALQYLSAHGADKFNIDYRFTEAAKPKRVAIMASKEDHCLLDLLWRNRRGELQMSVVMVIATHPHLAEHVRPFGVPFIHIPATRETRAEAEQRQLQLLCGNVDLVVLARYMQILSPAFLDAVGCPLINIHHSFLPAFTGAAPYKRARERGVKLVGATAHYVTEALDEGPII